MQIETLESTLPSTSSVFDESTPHIMMRTDTLSTINSKTGTGKKKKKKKKNAGSRTLKFQLSKVTSDVHENKLKEEP